MLVTTLVAYRKAERYEDREGNTSCQCNLTHLCKHIPSNAHSYSVPPRHNAKISCEVHAANSAHLCEILPDLTFSCVLCVTLRDVSGLHWQLVFPRL